MINLIPQISYQSIQQKQFNKAQIQDYSKNKLLNLNNQVFYNNQISFGKNEPKLIN